MADEENKNLTSGASFVSTGSAGQLGTVSSSQLGDLKRPENWVNKIEIDGNSGKDPVKDAGNAKWLNVSQGISNMTENSNDTTSKDSYWHDKGFQTTTVTGKNVSITVKGDRMVGDPAQDYIESLAFKMGDDVRTLVRYTNQSGLVLTAACTITKIQTFGGNANAQQTFSFEIDINGLPVFTTGGQNNDDGTGIGGVASKN